MLRHRRSPTTGENPRKERGGENIREKNRKKKRPIQLIRVFVGSFFAPLEKGRKKETSGERRVKKKEKKRGDGGGSLIRLFPHVAEPHQTG